MLFKYKCIKIFDKRKKNFNQRQLIRKEDNIWAGFLKGKKGNNTRRVGYNIQMNVCGAFICIHSQY